MGQQESKADGGLGEAGTRSPGAQFLEETVADKGKKFANSRASPRAGGRGTNRNAEPGQQPWRTHTKGSRETTSDQSLIQDRLKALHEQAKNALRKRKAKSRRRPQEVAKEGEDNANVGGTRLIKWVRSLSDDVKLVERLATWKVKTRSARESIKGSVATDRQYGDVVNDTETLGDYFDMAMASNAADFKQQQAKIVDIYHQVERITTEDEESRPTSPQASDANLIESSNMEFPDCCVDPRLGDLCKLKEEAEGLLRMYKNRTNARWVERESWVPPKVINPRVMMSGASSVDVYRYNARSAVMEGRVAFMIIDDGTQISTTEGRTHALVTADLWNVVRECWPNKIPQTHRLEGLSITGRKLLLMAVALERQFGSAAVKDLKIVIAVDYEEEVSLVKELCAWRFFGFKNTNIVIVTVPRFPGFVTVPGKRQLQQVPNSQKHSAGTGYAMMLLNSPAEGYTVSEDGREPEFLTGSVLEWLESSSARWLVTNMVSDIDRMRQDSTDHSIDLHFVAATFFAEEEFGASMSMEVATTTDERDIRHNDSLVLSRSSEPHHACNLKSKDLQTPATYQLMGKLLADTPKYICTRQYVFSVPHLSELLTGPTVFNPDVDVKNSCYAYMSFDMADITNMPEARCSPIMGRNQSDRSTSNRSFDKDWLYDMTEVLEAQDAQQSFRAMAIRVSEGRNRINVSGTDVDATALAAVLQVDNDTVSRMAMKLASKLMAKLTDRLHVVTWGPQSDKTTATLELFKDSELDFNQQIVRRVLDTGPDRPFIQALQQHLGLVDGQLLILGAEEFSQMGSFVRHTVKNISDVHVLVVKSDSLGRLFRKSDAHHITMMAHLDNNPTDLIEWLNQRLVAGRDVLYLARSQAFHKNGRLSVSSRRVLANARLCTDSRFRIEERTYKGAPEIELPKAVAKEEIDILVVSAAKGLDIPKHILQIIHEARTSVLVFRSQLRD